MVREVKCLPSSKRLQEIVGESRGLGLAVAVFLVGLVLFFKFGAVPGDLGDARFNMYVLEHGHRWLMRLDQSFWSAPFFYPAQNVIAYSDNHLGSLLAYSLFRILGANRETAFQLWAITIFLLNYFVTYAVVQRQKFSQIGAIVCAYLFTFSMIMAAQMSHLQLAPRFMVPVAFWMIARFLETGSTKHLSLSLAACAFQVYLGIYIGYFLLISLIPFLALMILLKRRWTAIRFFFIRVGIPGLLRRGLAYACSGLAFGAVLLPIAVPYYQAQQEIGGRSWEELVPLLPRWQSYLYAPESILWGRILRFGDGLTMAHEHALFFGFLPLVGIFLFVFLIWNRKATFTGSEVGIAMLGALLVLVVFTFYFSGFSFYRFAWTFLPGAGGIRGVTRIALVLVYFVAFVSGSVATYIVDHLETAYGSWSSWLWGIGVLTMISLEQVSAVPSMSKSECTERIDRLTARIDSSGRKVLWVCYQSNEPSIFEQLDAMLAGQDLGLNVVNGYSGLKPKNYPMSLAALTDDKCSGISLWARLHPDTIDNDRLLQIGPHCQIPEDDFLPAPMGGFTTIENGDTLQALAINRSAELGIPRTPETNLAQILSFDLSTVKISRLVKISDVNGQAKYIHLLPEQSQHVEISVSPENRGKVLKFETDQEGEKLGHGDKRRWFYFISNMHLRQAQQ
jgi:hypothetical protein